MKILVYLGHPAQYHFIKLTVRKLRGDGHDVEYIIRTKDMLENLLTEDNEVFFNILPEGRKPSGIHILWGLLKRDLRLFRYARGRKFDLFIGTDPSVAHVGRILRIPVLTVLEDDIKVIASLARLTYPFTSYIVTPGNVNIGRFSYKKIGYPGYMKLAYLHPDCFTPGSVGLPKPYFIIRLSGLNAYHDKNVCGLNDTVLENIFGILSNAGTVYISTERKLPERFDKYLLKIKQTEIHNYLANACMLISDSQSMSMESAMLGVPSIRFSDFSGRISVLEELEHRYGLTFGIKTSSPESLFDKLNELLLIPDLKEEFQNRRQKMLADKINVTEFMVWLVENYPGSIEVIKKDPEYMIRFR